MLQTDFFHTSDGKISIHFNPHDPEDIPTLRDGLESYKIYNPAYTFAQRYKNNYYDGCSDEHIAADADICNILSEFWKETDDSPGELSQNVMILLSRLTHVYLQEHAELVRLRQERNQQ